MKTILYSFESSKFSKATEREWQIRIITCIEQFTDPRRPLEEELILPGWGISKERIS